MEITLNELIQAISQKEKKDDSNFLSGYIGKYVICRTRNEGINAGKVKAINSTGVVLEDSKRIWYHKPSDQKLSWYEGVAISGLSDDSRVSASCDKVIVEDYSLTICTSEAELSIRHFIPNPQN